MRVLIVEDDMTYGRLQTYRLLASPKTRFETHHVQTLQAALDHLAEHPVDAALVDLNLPDTEGAGTVRALHLAHPELPIIVVTGEEDPDMHAAAKLSGATELTVKGEDSDETLELRVLAAAYRKAYARLIQQDPIGPVARALVSDIGLHLRGGELVVRDLRGRIAAGEELEMDFLDRSLAQIQESLAPMHFRPSDAFMLEELDLAKVMGSAADHVVDLAIYGEPHSVTAQETTVQRAMAAVFSTLYDVAGPVQVTFEKDDHTVVVHIASKDAPAMKREHPLLWTMANDLLAFSMATLHADDTGFTLRFASA